MRETKEEGQGSGIQPGTGSTILAPVKLKHTIYYHELKSMNEAVEALFSPQPGDMDARSAYQRLHHMIEMLETRSW